MASEALVATERWQDIYSPPEMARRPSLYTAHRLSIPKVAKPQHPEHCGDRHEVDGVMMCPSCKVPAYKVIGHSWFHDSSMMWFSYEPMNGSPDKYTSDTPVCNCGRKMERRWL
jgi:hypothetical protein